MTTSIISRTVIATCALCLPSLAWAGAPEPGILRGTISAGTEIFATGNLHGGTVTTVPSLATLNSGLPAVPATLTIRSRKYSDVYDAPIQLSAELSYGMSENIEVFGSVYYSKTEGKRLQVGTADVAALTTVYPVFGKFGDLTNLGLEAGGRYFFGNGRFIPFLGGSVGIVNQDGIKATFTIPGAPAGGITLSNVPFFKATTSATLGLEAGLAANLTEQFSGRVSVGVKHITAFRGDDTGLAGLGLQTINNDSQRTTFPIKASLAASF